MLTITAKQLPGRDEEVLFRTTSWTTAAQRLERLASYWCENGYHGFRIYLGDRRACLDDIPVAGMFKEQIAVLRACMAVC
jgi:hypothetical protein